MQRPAQPWVAQVTLYGSVLKFPKRVFNVSWFYTRKIALKLKSYIGLRGPCLNVSWFYTIEKLHLNSSLGLHGPCYTVTQYIMRSHRLKVIVLHILMEPSPCISEPVADFHSSNPFSISRILDLQNDGHHGNSVEHSSGFEPDNFNCSFVDRCCANEEQNEYSISTTSAGY